MALNPLLQERLVAGQLSDVGRVPALYAYLINDRRRIVTSVNWDARVVSSTPEAQNDPAGPLGVAWRTAVNGGAVTLHGVDVDGATLRSTAAAAASNARSPRPIRGVTHLDSDIVTIFRIDPAEDAADALMTAAEMADDGVDVVLALGENADHWVSAALLALRFSAVQSVRDTSDLLERVRAASDQDTAVVVRGAHAQIDADGLRELARTAATGVAAAPLWLDSETGTIVSAGTFFRGGSAYDLLRGHPSEDAEELPLRMVVPATTSPTFAARGVTTTHVVRTDVISRAPKGPPASLAPQPDSDLEELLAPAGLVPRSWTDHGPVLARPRRLVELSTGQHVPSLRWAIKIAAPPGHRGEWWGDTHFARGLADALRRLGQEVVIDAYAARERSSQYLDDVVLALRGPEPIRPQSGAYSILWVISHPDEITDADIDGFDTVFAASTQWATQASSAFGRPVLPLLQCTDPHRFHPIGAAHADGLLFVGTARGIPRPSVIEPVRAGIPVSVYGPDWTGWIPGSAIRGSGVPNSELPLMYERASAVLNDHWPAMSAAGFVSNRLFDVVGAGGRAISDRVSGIAELFEGAVLTYDTIPELLALLRGDLDAAFPPDDELLRISQRVRAEHSFDARALRLLETVLAK